ncbi:hypothetical protein [Methylococcus mesophilus]|nr:hypothetical protein [Methylococcus mesophilus]UZR30434.1 hypothetical protein OOT43_07320 [Methylococcus mesophilus]
MTSMLSFIDAPKVVGSRSLAGNHPMERGHMGVRPPTHRPR